MRKFTVGNYANYVPYSAPKANSYFAHARARRQRQRPRPRPRPSTAPEPVDRGTVPALVENQNHIDSENSIVINRVTVLGENFTSYKKF